MTCPSRPSYKYRAVSGVAVWGEPTGLSQTMHHVDALRPVWPHAEIERVMSVADNGHRYWRWRSGKWSTDFWTDPSPADLARWEVVS